MDSRSRVSTPLVDQRWFVIVMATTHLFEKTARPKFRGVCNPCDHPYRAE